MQWNKQTTYQKRKQKKTRTGDKETKKDENQGTDIKNSGETEKAPKDIPKEVSDEVNNEIRKEIDDLVAKITEINTNEKK